MSEPDKDHIREIVSGKKTIPTKWIVFSILVFALFYHVALLLTHE